MKGPETPQPGSTRHNAVGKAQLPWQSSSSAVTDLVSPRARPVVLALPVRRTGGALRGGGARRALGSEDSTASVGSYSYNPNGLRTSNFGSTTASYSSNARNYLTGYQNNTYAYDADADGDSSRSSSDSDASSADANTGLPSYSSVVSGETSSGSLSYTTTSSVYNAAQQLCWSSSPAVALGGSPGGCSTPPKGATAYSYDPSGRLTSVSIPQPSSTNTVSLSYGPYGNLACFAPPNSSGYNCSGNPWKGYTSTYTYNADHLRMSVTPDGASTQIFAWDTVSSSVARIISDATNYYIYGPNILGGAPEPVEQIPVGATTASSASYLVFSPRSLRMIISSVGQVDNFYFCSAWGNCGACATLTGTCSPGPVTSPFGFAGGYTDSSGLVYLINRYYAPMLREFISVDRAVATTGTPYAYAGNDPMNWVDPSGLCWDLPRGYLGPCPPAPPGINYNSSGLQVTSVAIPGRVYCFKIFPCGWGMAYGSPSGSGSASHPSFRVPVRYMSCAAGAFGAVSNEVSQDSWFGGVWFASQFVPGVDVGVDVIAGVGTLANAFVGCVSPPQVVRAAGKTSALSCNAFVGCVSPPQVGVG